ncbi:MAG: tRNA-intron lyase, partial [Thermoplasmatales archaeon]|nr:tRNA-intron lyase [Thermoplasmatales archaeon]
GPVRVIREDHKMDFSVMFNNGSCIYAALDDDNDVTVFISEPWNETGENDFMITRGKAVRNLFSTSIVDTSEVPEWFGNYIGGVKFLNQYEAAILSESGPDKKTDQNIVQEVYDDLISRKFIVKTGFKYGSNFRIYSRTIEEHADFLVHVLDGPEEWYKISRGIRVAQGVRKEMIFAGKTGDKLEYIKLKRVRDPFNADF